MRHAVTLQVGAEPLPGYRLLQPRGRGGFAEVWEAETADRVRVALKFMAMANASAAAKEIRSIQALSRLRHPHLIRIDQVWSQAGYIIIAMELADGSLLELLDAYQTEFHTAVNPAVLCTYLTQAAEALDYLNGRTHDLDGRRVAYQHCDIKPSNLLLQGDVLKVADFGLATATVNVGPTPHPRSGTLDFAAPEIFQGMLSERSDQYSLAVTYCYLRGGRFPFPEPPAKFERTYVRPPPDLSMLSPEEQPILRRGLSPVPQNRWPSCAALIEPLTRLACRVEPRPLDAAARTGSGSAYRRPG